MSDTFAGNDGIEGRVALVTGAGQGIGRAIAHELAAAGALVCANDIDADKAAVTASEVGGFAAPFDVSDRTAVRTGIARCEAERGPVSLLVANHAYMRMGPFTAESDTDWERTLDVNLLGTAWLFCSCAPAMAERGYGRIVAITSEWGITGWPNATSYSTSKAGIIALVKSAAQRYVRAGVAVNAVAPGVTDTPQLDVDAADAGLTHQEMVDRYALDAPLGRIGTPSDIAKTVAFLLSAPAIGFVGQVLSPNGGTTRL